MLTLAMFFLYGKNDFYCIIHLKTPDRCYLYPCMIKSVFRLTLRLVEYLMASFYHAH